MERAIAIIPARGGSKRVPRKNIKNFLGFPIIKYSIDAANNSKCFNEVMVSTDDQEIASIAQKYGAHVPFLRSEEASSDFAMTADVICEVLQEYKKIGKEFDYVCCIYPTAPFITPQLLHEGFMMLKKNNVDSVIPVVRFSYPIQRALKFENNKLEMVWPENLNVRSQDLIPRYHDVGQFYWLRISAFLDHKVLFQKNSLPLEIQEIRMQDIDSVDDWNYAEIKYKILNNM